MPERGGEPSGGATPTGESVIADGGVPNDRVLVMNPVSGDGSHSERVRELADEAGFTVMETSESGDGVEFGRRAADADLVAAAGGDGTVNEVARGLDDADALGDVTLGVVPAGTGNNFAGNLGVESVEHAFELLRSGERRRIDVATADGRIFLNSAIAGVTAEASAETSPEMKDRLGILAYVVAGLRTVREFDGLPLSVEADCPGSDKTWSGEAAVVLVGNARRFPQKGRSQANCEDGLLEVTIDEQSPPTDLLEDAALHRLFGGETDGVTNLRASELRMDVRRDEPVGFSFDGEMDSYGSLTTETREGAAELCVGEGYDPDPD